MWIEVEPADFFMFRVSLLFSEAAPDPEDEWVRDYLREHHLEPRRQGKIERDGEPIDVLQFGQCYLGPHAVAIRDLRGRSIERSALLQAVPDILRQSGIVVTADDGDPAATEALIARIAEAVHPAAKFVRADDDRVGISLEPEIVVAAYQSALNQNSETTRREIS